MPPGLDNFLEMVVRERHTEREGGSFSYFHMYI